MAFTLLERNDAKRKPYSPLVTPASSDIEEEFLEEVKTL